MGWTDAPEVGTQSATPKWAAAPELPTAQSAAPRFTPTAGMLEEPIGRERRPTGVMERPSEDWAAMLEAEKKDALLRELGMSSPLQETMGAVSEGIAMNADRPIAGAVSWMSGDGYQHGKAVDAYMDEMRADRLGGAGTAAEVVGSVLSPSPVSKGKLMWKALQEALIGGSQSAAEGQNLATQGDQRNVGDFAEDFGIGGVLSGALSGVGDAVRPGEIIDAAKTQKGVNQAVAGAVQSQNIPRVETAGLNLREALVKEQGALKEAGRDAMKRAVKGDFAVVPTAGSSVLNSIDEAYKKISDAPIPITPQGTPAAAAFKDQIIMEVGKGNDLTLGQIDALRVKARGLRSSAANKTDQTALNNLEKSLDKMVDEKIGTGEFMGDPAYKEAYSAGRGKYEKAMQIADIPKIKQLLKDDTIPGAAIADSLLSINSSSKSKSPARVAKVVADTLGEGSESLAAVRGGVLATLFEGASTDPAAQSRLLRTLERNEMLLGDLLTPDQVSELAGIRVDLSNAADAAEGSAARVAAEKRVNSFLNGVLGGAGKVFKDPAKTGAMSGLVTGSAATGISTAAAIATLKGLASRPSRTAVSFGAGAGNKAIGRLGAQDEDLDAAIPNPRDAIIQQLGAQ